MAAVNSAYMLKSMNDKLALLALYAALFTTVPTATGGTEVSGGAPAYARKAQTPGTPTTAVPSTLAWTVPAHDVPSGAGVQGYGSFDAITAGNFIQGNGVTLQSFASQGTYQVSPTNTQS